MSTTLTRLAAAAGGVTTKTAARATLKAAGLKQTMADDLLKAATDLHQARILRQMARISRHLGYWPIDPLKLRWVRTSPATAWRDPSHGTPACLGMASRPLHLAAAQWRGRIGRGSVADRLDNLRRLEVGGTYGTCYRQPGSDHGSLTINLTSDPAAVGAHQLTHQDYTIYRGSHRGRPAQVTNTTVTVPRDWRVRVQRRGIAIVDGMMTIDAATMPAPDGIELFSATWLVQGRGYAVTPARGYIARRGTMSYHGDTAKAALDGLSRKTRAGDQSIKWDQAIAAHGLEGLAARLPAGAVVRIADAKAIGACDYGIRSWCHATGLPYDAGQAPLVDVLSAYRREPRTEARAAILHAMRRYRAIDRGS